MNSSFGARRFAAAGAAVVCALVLAACGGSNKTSSPTTTTPTTAAGRGARTAAFRTCMSQHGVSLPADFNFGGGRRGGATGTTGTIPTTTLPPGVTAQQYRSALQECVSTLGGGGGANNPRVAAYRSCLNLYLSSNGGTTLPSTGFGGFGGGFGGANGATTTTNPLMEAAINHCANLRPAFPGRGSTTTSTTT